MNVYNDITELIGKTPILYLEKYCKKNETYAAIYAKMEMFNPFGSIKDRVALKMIEDAEKKGLINKDSTIIEPTSGNTGIGLAAICATRGYKCIIVMPENACIERIKVLKAYNATVILTPTSKGLKGVIRHAEEIAEQVPNSYVPYQFRNKSNPLIHQTATAKEIYKDMDGKVDIIISGIGTGGTISGLAKFFKKKNPDVKIIGVEPLSSPFITKGYSGVHQIQGIGAGFIPKVLKLDLIDEVIAIDDNDAMDKARELAHKYALFFGISSAAAMIAATEVAKRIENAGKNIVVIIPDNGQKYLSCQAFD